MIEYREVFHYNVYPRGDGGMGIGLPRPAGLKSRQRMKCLIVEPGFVVPARAIVYMEDTDAQTPKAKRARAKAS